MTSDKSEMAAGIVHNSTGLHFHKFQNVSTFITASEGKEDRTWPYLGVGSNVAFATRIQNASILH